MKFSPILLGLSAFVSQASAGRLIREDIPDRIPNKYIVRYNSDITPEQQAEHEAEVNRGAGAGFKGIEKRFSNTAFKGYSVNIGKGLLDKIVTSEFIDIVEPDARVQLNVPAPAKGGKKGPPGGGDGGDPEPPAEDPVPWGLNRISHRRLSSAGDYPHDSSSGAGSRVYVLDTGVDIDHPDFGGRAEWGTNTIDNQDRDDDGHGTHCAGTIGGTTYGVSKNTSIVAVKVLGTNGGSWASVLGGIDFVVADATAKGVLARSVISMSLGGGGCDLDLTSESSIYQSVRAAKAAGVTVVVAAGNDGRDSSYYIPACFPEVITVAASSESDRQASFSNTGAPVDIFAPGVDIESTWPGGRIAVLSGTSMACPHVSGLAAYFIGLGHSGPDALQDRIVSLATSGALKRVGRGTVNLLAYNGIA